MMTRAVWTRVADVIMIIKSLITDDCHIDVNSCNLHSTNTS